MTPIPFEAEFPLAASVLMRLSQWNNRKAFRWHIIDRGVYVGSPRGPLPLRNQLCGCGSEKKFKRCCEAATRP